MTSINPGNRDHAQLEDDVRQYLNALNYYTTEATYHSVMPEHICNRLSRIFTLGALYLRGRADRVAIHKTKDIVFEWEAKTHTNRKYTDITIELLPLLHHVNKSSLGARCLYVCRDTHLGRNCGFWAHETPRIREMHFINGKLSAKIERYIKKITQELLPETMVRNLSRNIGSGDPYIIIDSRIADKLPHWKDLISELENHAQ